jgi:hypothetical protein
MPILVGADFNSRSNQEKVRMDKQEWQKEMVEWLESFQWLWFCTLTFRPGLSEPQAKWRLEQWLGELKEALGTDQFQWVSVAEWGKTRADLHYHVLVRGLREWQAAQRVDFMKRWNRGCGNARIDPYRPGVGGVRYILKTIEPGGADRIDMNIVSLPGMATESSEEVTLMLDATRDDSGRKASSKSGVGKNESDHPTWENGEECAEEEDQNEQE